MILPQRIAMNYRSAPTIETERLVLRAWTKADFRPYLAIVGDAEVMRFVGGKGLGEEEGWRRLSASVGMWDLLGFGGWAAVRKSDEKLVGMVSLFNAWRALEPQFGEEPEMGWIVATETHGQGLAGEARFFSSSKDRSITSAPCCAC